MQDAAIDPARAMLPAVLARNEERVRRGFWAKLRRFAGRIPFAEDATAAYFCATDRKTPLQVRATLLAALAYFVLPADLVPDLFAGLGFTDDAAVIAAALALVGSHMTPDHRARAREALAGGENRPGP